MNCVYHKDRPAVNTCSRCGQPVCAGCNYITGSSPICRQCWDKIERATMDRGSMPYTPYCEQPVSTKETIETREQKRTGNQALLISGLGVVCLGSLAFYISTKMVNDYSSWFPKVKNVPPEPAIWFILAMVALTIISGVWYSLHDRREEGKSGAKLFIYSAIAFQFCFFIPIVALYIIPLAAIAVIAGLISLGSKLHSKGFAATCISTVSILSFMPFSLFVHFLYRGVD
jgi:hypothetical protein